MKILEITLINFARVFSGMGKTKITLDFRNVEEKINLFVGANGSGKTSILRCIHPFAYNTAMGDGSTNANLIISKKDGRKSIIIQADDKHVYHIQHVYTRTKDDNLTVKSYIAENNEELNDSGVTTTFKAIVKEKLGVDESYLTLLSMSNSIKGFVEFTASNRKAYASKIFTALDIYSRKYKEMQAQDRAMKSLLSNVSSKLSRYSGIDRSGIREELRTTEKNLELLNQKHSMVLNSIGNIQGQLDSLNYISTEYSGYQAELTELLQRISNLKSKLTTSDSIDDIQTQKQKLMDEKLRLEVEQVKLESDIHRALDMRSSELKHKETFEKELSGLEVGTSVKELQEQYDYIDRQINLMKEVSLVGDLETFQSPIDKDTLIRTVVYLDELNSIMHNILFDVNNREDIDVIWDMYQKHKVTLQEVTNEYNKAVADREQYELIHQGFTIKTPGITSKCTDPNCPYKEFYDRYIAMIEVSKDDESLMRLKVRESKAYNTLSIVQILEKAMSHIEKYKDYLKTDVLKDMEIFDIHRFVSLYLETNSVYDSHLATEYIDLLENQVIYKELNDKLQVCKERMKIYQSNEKMISSLQSSISHAEEEISKLDVEIESLKGKLHSDEIDKLASQISNLEENENLMIEIRDIQKEITTISGKMTSMQASMDNINQLRFKLDGYHTEQLSLKQQIQEMLSKKESLTLTITNIETLEQEEIELRKNYDIVEHVRFAVSPTTGLPVEFIRYYMKEEMADRINLLLDTVYRGRFRIMKDAIDVSEDNFTIPYIKNQTTVVNDISMASDGEKAILSLAFSLVLIQLTQTDAKTHVLYAIALFDEMDATLDNESRAKFIDLLEIYMGSIHAGQVFLVSHNNMFDSYPVNVILTSEMETFNYSNANVMKLYAS